MSSGLDTLDSTAQPNRRQAGGSEESGHKPKVLVLCTSPLIERMLVYSDFMTHLSANALLKIWASSYNVPELRKVWSQSPGAVESFPQIRPFKEFPYNFLRRLNEFVWDFRQRTPSRLSIIRHVRDKSMRSLIRSLKTPARVLAWLRSEQVLENALERLLLSYPRSAEALQRLQTDPPDVLVTTGPFQYEQPAVIATAKKLGIPVLCLIPSWDNLSTKNRMVFKYDGYLVWSERTKQELGEYYPETRNRPVFVVGAPQFDPFFQKRFQQTREEFCAGQGLRPELPIILHALGSPNFLREEGGALELARRIKQGELGDVQLVVRPHPAHHNDATLEKRFSEFGPRVIVQKTPQAGAQPSARSQDESQILEWVNTFRHLDVLVNTSSTVAVDAAIFDRPVINLDYDSEPGQPNQQLIKDINHLWTHYKPVAESGGVWQVNNPDELIAAIRKYLAQPELHREKRRWLVEYVCGFADGKCGHRMAQGILDFAQTHARKVRRA